MLSFEYDQLTIPMHLLSKIKRIDEFNGTWKAIQMLAPDRLSSLKYTATIESIGASTRIEGVTLTDAEIETFLKSMTTTSFRSRDEQEVAGYADVMDVIFENYESIDITENFIKQLHSILLKFTEKDVGHRGGYKTSTNSVGAFIDGKLKAIIFETASPFETPFLMKQLIEWHDKSLAQDWHPLVIIGIFIVVFLAIHPFQDGNGRLSRILTTLMLLKFNYSYVPYVSLEHIVEDNKADYYKALQQTQITLRSEKPNFYPWLSFFFMTLEMQMNLLSMRIAEIKRIQKLSKISTDILNAIQVHTQLSIVQLSELLGINRNTVRNHVYQLVHGKYLKQHGQGRGVFYTVAD
ncbi:MAG: Fic family protein [Alphaproteobacteria bacterium]